MWQIGRPQKAVFDSARTYPNALITDTVNTYPVNDTSVFILKQEWPTAHFIDLPRISFSFQLQKDSGDIAIIEYSSDTGKTWKNLMKSGEYHFNVNRISIDTSTIGWVYMTTYFFPLSQQGANTDSIFYRFTFISDSVDSHQDGWIIDDILLDYYWEGYVPTVHSNTLISIYPNPCTNELFIKSKSITTHTPQVSIYDALGRQLYNAALTTDNIPINLPNGTYLLRYTTDDAVAQKRFVVRR